MDYWKSYWNDDQKVGGPDLKINVGRTVKGVPIMDSVWRKTIADTERLLDLDKDRSKLLELCCGNGEMIGHLYCNCKSCTGVDFSQELLAQLEKNYEKSVKVILNNALDVSFNKESFNGIIIYASLQYFNEQEVIKLINNCIRWLESGGKLFIGDIPNEKKKWEFMNRDDYKRDYIRQLEDDKPIIGNWFHPDFFLAIGLFFKDLIDVQILKQSDDNFSSNYRFDVLIHKK